MPVQAHKIYQALEKKHRLQSQPWAFFTEVKNGPSYTGMLKLDAVAIKKSWTKPCIIGYEIKVSRSDFLSDEKWPGYLDYCHKFFFVCPAGVIEPEELPETVGLITYNVETAALHTRKAAVMRMIDLPTNMFLYLIMNRIGETHHPFFSSAREELEEWVKDKEERKQLGYQVSTKLVKKLEAFEAECRQLKRDKDCLAGHKQTIEKIKDILAKHGYCFRWNLPEEIDRILTNKDTMPPELRSHIKGLVDAYKNMK